MPAATRVPTSPTMMETRLPCTRRLSTSRPWKSVPRMAVELPPSNHMGGAKNAGSTPSTGSVGSWGAMMSAKMATTPRSVRSTTAARGISRTVRSLALSIALVALIGAGRESSGTGSLAKTISAHPSRNPLSLWERVRVRAFYRVSRIRGSM